MASTNKRLAVLQLDALSSVPVCGNGSSHVPSTVTSFVLRGEIIPPFSFEPDAAYLSGRFPEETDGGTHFWYAPEASRFKGMRRWGWFGDRMPYLIQLGLRRWVRWRAARKAETDRLERSVSTARIPFRLLPYFDVVTKHYPFEQDFCSYSTIFDLLREEGRKWVYIGAPVSGSRSDEVLARLRASSLPGVDLVFLFVGDLDGIGHEYGPHSEMYQRALQRMGVLIEEIASVVDEKMGKGCPLLVFGDHGMAQVTRLVDVGAALKGLSIRPCRDYVYLLDSTLARFWFFGERARQEVMDLMSQMDGGSIVSEEERVSYRIRYPHNRFGELIWWADGGTLIFPNFWQDRKPVKGMHGYRRDVIENHAAFLLLNTDLEESQTLEQPLEMVDVFATIVDMLDLKMPKGAYGKSVLKKEELS